jgi:hypothetical protein
MRASVRTDGAAPPDGFRLGVPTNLENIVEDFADDSSNSLLWLRAPKLAAEVRAPPGTACMMPAPRRAPAPRALSPCAALRRRSAFHARSSCPRRCATCIQSPSSRLRAQPAPARPQTPPREGRAALRPHVATPRCDPALRPRVTNRCCAQLRASVHFPPNSLLQAQPLSRATPEHKQVAAPRPAAPPLCGCRRPHHPNRRLRASTTSSWRKISTSAAPTRSTPSTRTCTATGRMGRPSWLPTPRRSTSASTTLTLSRTGCDTAPPKLPPRGRGRSLPGADAARAARARRRWFSTLVQRWPTSLGRRRCTCRARSSRGRAGRTARAGGTSGCRMRSRARGIRRPPSLTTQTRLVHHPRTSQTRLVHHPRTSQTRLVQHLKLSRGARRPSGCRAQRLLTRRGQRRSPTRSSPWCA